MPLVRLNLIKTFQQRLTFPYVESNIAVSQMGEAFLAALAALYDFEFDYRAVSIPLLERLWIYFRKMNIPLPEQPYITNLWIRARLLWCDPGQQRWLFLPTVDSTTTSHASHIRPSFAMTTFTTRLPTPMSENWLRQLQPHIWLPSLATTTSTPAMSTPSPSSLHIEHQYRLTSSMSEFWAQLARSGSSCFHCLFSFFTSSQDQHSACYTILHNGWRHRDQLVLQS